MAEIRAFRGLRYNPQRFSNTASLISPPYDVISSEQKQELLSHNPYNVVRLILPDGTNPYENAAEILQTWVREEILVTEREPAIYCYHQTYLTPQREEKTRKGFLALIRLEEFDKGIVLPHEATLSAPKEDRLQLLRSCKTNFSPIFSLYSDPQEEIENLLRPFTEAGPAVRARGSDGILNSLWTVTDPEIIDRVQEIMKNHWVLIADGHHRYESCLMYRNERQLRDPNPDAPFQYTLMFFSNLNHPGITILPYNRAVHSLPDFNPETVRQKATEYFDARQYESREKAYPDLKSSENSTALIAQYRGSGSAYLYRLKNVDLDRFYTAGTPVSVQNLDVNVLHRIFLEEILGISQEDLRQQKYLKYYKDEQEEYKDFDSGRLQIAFYLNPTRIEQVVEVSRAGKNMPQKSTFFYPKLMTGLVMRSMQSEL